MRPNHHILALGIAALLAGCNESELGALPAAHSEVHFQGGAAPPVDVLWIVDNSGSMQQEQTKLGNNFNSFIQYFTALQLDFQMAVTTSDVEVNSKGEFVGPILNSATPNLNQAFLNQVNVGTSGSGQERGLEAARLALSEPNISGPNAGFLRPNAILAIIVVTDEEDGDEWPGGVPPVQEYINFFTALKGGDLNTINFSGIYGAVVETGVAAPCTSPDADAEAGVRYEAVIEALNGVKASICAPDFGPVLDNLGSVIAGLATAFPLDYTPVVESITVKVDGVTIPMDPLNGWTWNATLGGIVFAPSAVPDECAVIEISYGVEDYGGPLQDPDNDTPPPQCSSVQVSGGGSLDGGALECSVGESRPFDAAAAWLPGLLALTAIVVMLRRRRA